MTDPVQQQLVAARRNQILDAAAAVFAEKGFHPATTRDIARQAGISEGTIYNYFDNKQALLLGMFDRMKASIVEAAPPAGPTTDVRTFLQTFLHHPLMALKANNFALFRIIVSEMMVNDDLRTQYYNQILEPTLALGEAYLQHALRSPADARLAIRAISGMVLGLMLEHAMGDGVLERQWDELPAFLADLLTRGLEEAELKDE